MKGPAGYGRYDDDPGYIGCPWAKSDMSPCVARDGAVCLSSGAHRVCVGCNHSAHYLIKYLAEQYAPARAGMPVNPATAADWLRGLVRAATEPDTQNGAAPRSVRGTAPD